MYGIQRPVTFCSYCGERLGCKGVCTCIQETGLICYICGVAFQNRTILGVHIADCYRRHCETGGRYLPNPMDVVIDGYTLFMKQKLVGATPQQQHHPVGIPAVRALQQQSHPTVGNTTQLLEENKIMRQQINNLSEMINNKLQNGKKKIVKKKPSANTNNLPNNEVLKDKIAKVIKPLSDGKQKVRIEAPEEKWFSCPDCSQSLLGLESYTEHVRSCSKSVEEPQLIKERMSCPNCSEHIFGKDAYDHHIRFCSKHVSESPVVSTSQPTCQKCGRTFGVKAFAVHIKSCGVDLFDRISDNERLEFQQQQPTTDSTNHPQGSLAALVSGQRTDEETETGDKKWTQFMITYPRPVIADKPQSREQRSHPPPSSNSASCSKCDKLVPLTELDKHEAQCTLNRVLMPCKHCNRRFATDRLDIHERSCVRRDK